jgi:hypothetical protein
MAGSRDAIVEGWHMTLRQTATGPAMYQYLACSCRLAQPYIVDVQALSIHADNYFMSLSLLEAAVAGDWRGIYAAIVCV